MFVSVHNCRVELFNESKVMQQAIIRSSLSSFLKLDWENVIAKKSLSYLSANSPACSSPYPMGVFRQPIPEPSIRMVVFCRQARRCSSQTLEYRRPSVPHTSPSSPFGQLSRQTHSPPWHFIPIGHGLEHCALSRQKDHIVKNGNLLYH